MILAADHVVGDAQAFVAAVRAASGGARAGYIMTLGVTPGAPATTFGYIQPGPRFPEEAEGCRVERFLEKPTAERAAGLIAEGALWNSDYFLFRADVMLEELRLHAPIVLQQARAALARATADLDFVRLDAAAFAQAPRISIDHAMMEHTARAGVLPAGFAWSDVGTWARSGTSCRAT